MRRRSSIRGSSPKPLFASVVFVSAFEYRGMIRERKRLEFIDQCHAKSEIRLNGQDRARGPVLWLDRHGSPPLSVVSCQIQAPPRKYIRIPYSWSPSSAVRNGCWGLGTASCLQREDFRPWIVASLVPEYIYLCVCVFGSREADPAYLPTIGWATRIGDRPRSIECNHMPVLSDLANDTRRGVLLDTNASIKISGSDRLYRT